MSELEELLRASVTLAEVRKQLAAADIAMDYANDRIADLHAENARLKTAILARDMIIDTLRDAKLALLQKQAE